MSKTLETRLDELERRSGGDRVIVVRRGDVLTVGGQEISEADLKELKETHDVVLIHIVEEGDDELAEAS